MGCTRLPEMAEALATNVTNLMGHLKRGAQAA
jgi:hypothetical protein